MASLRLAPLASTSKQPAIADGSDGVASSSTAGASVPCGVCKIESAKYTCPACSTRSCSLECTRRHKEETSCSGERSRTAYVSMDSYGDVAMWRDLSFLRQVSDKVSEWGESLSRLQGGATAGAGSNKSLQQRYSNDKGKGRDFRDDGRHHAQSTATVNERVASLPMRELKLKRALASRGIELLFVPLEMQRHRDNRTKLNPKRRSVQLTVGVVTVTRGVRSVHGNDAEKARQKEGEEQKHTKVSHGHDLSSDLLGILRDGYRTCNNGKQATNSSLDAMLDQVVILLRVPVRSPPPPQPRPWQNYPTSGEGGVAETIISARQSQDEKLKAAAREKKEEDKPLPAPHSSLPAKPAWAVDLVQVEEEEEDVSSGHQEVVAKGADENPTTTQASIEQDEQERRKREARKVARRYWKVPLDTTTAKMTLQDALKGTAILEWPDFEIWPREIVEHMVAREEVEFVARRDFDPERRYNVMKRGHEEQHGASIDDGQQVVDHGNKRARTTDQTGSTGSDDTDTDSDSSSSSSDDAGVQVATE